MQKILLVIDMQNDFIDGALGSKEAVAIVPKVKEKIEQFDGTVLFTRDTHDSHYLHTQEGRKLPVVHCIRDTEGWQIHPALEALRTTEAIDKNAFGSTELPARIMELNAKEPVESITVIGVCTDICVLANSMILKAFLPEINVIVDAACCAGISPEGHKNALQAMKVCQIEVIHES